MHAYISVAPSFTTYQREAINFKDLPIELWEIKRYENDTVSYNQIRTSGSRESIKTISRENDVLKSNFAIVTLGLQTNTSRKYNSCDIFIKIIIIVSAQLQHEDIIKQLHFATADASLFSFIHGLLRDLSM